MLPLPPQPRRRTPPPRVYQDFGPEHFRARLQELDLEIRDEKTLLLVATAGYREDAGAAIIVVPEAEVYNMVDKLEPYNYDFDPSFCFPITIEEFPLGGRHGYRLPLTPQDIDQNWSVLIVSFEYLASEVDALNRFRADCMYHKAGHSDWVPDRPELALLDPYWYSETNIDMGWVMATEDRQTFQFLSPVELRYYVATLGLVV
ncbi:hypothetical protein FGRMN_2538 [Fusarium graminum]|nr:hypothetical protein FGRMN_2538 [Fusarium graminum]